MRIVALSAKMYATFLSQNILMKEGFEPSSNKDINIESKKAKGIKKYVVEKRVKHDSYQKCLFSRIEECTQMLLKSKDHQIGMYEQKKVCLSPIDTKRYILNDGILIHMRMGITK